MMRSLHSMDGSRRGSIAAEEFSTTCFMSTIACRTTYPRVAPPVRHARAAFTFALTSLCVSLLPRWVGFPSPGVVSLLRHVGVLTKFVHHVATRPFYKRVSRIGGAAGMAAQLRLEVRTASPTGWVNLLKPYGPTSHGEYKTITLTG